MHGSLIVFAGLAVACALILVRQIVERPVTRGSLLLPPVLCVGLGALFLSHHPAPGSIAAVVGGAAIGVGTGLLGAQVIQIRRDQATGVVLQRGGWRYLLVLIALLLVRVLLRLVLSRGGVVDATELNGALVAALASNFLGRDIRTAVRALSLSGGRFSGLSNT